MGSVSGKGAFASHLPLCFSCLVLTACHAFEPAEDLDDFVAQLDEGMDDALASKRVPGVAVAVGIGGELAWSKGYGFADEQDVIPVEADTTLFQAASISKTTSGWAAQLAAEEGLLDLDQPIEEILTSWSFPESKQDVDEVTLRRLLTHTAGTSVSGYTGYPVDEGPPTLLESLDGARDADTMVELVREPGSKYSYSGGGISVAQQALEDATATSYAAWVEGRILEPLGLEKATFDADEFTSEDVASPYLRAGKPGDLMVYAELAAAGLLITADELLIYALAVVEGPGGEPPGRDIISPESVDEMLSNQAEAGDWGLGWWRVEEDGYDIAGHTGSNVGGFISLMQVVPETGDALVVLTNSENGWAICDDVRRAWLGMVPE